MLNPPSVFIVIVNWNGYRDTLDCIRSLKNMAYSNYSIVVVDNGSTDSSVIEIQKLYDDIILIESGENRGFAGGSNLGIKYALKNQADYVWLLNNDTVVDEGALTALVERMEGDADIGMCGSRLLYHDKPEVIQALAGGVYHKWIGISRDIGHGKPVSFSYNAREVEGRLQYIAGASMLVSRTFINEIGLLNEEYFLYYEELDWALRAKGTFKLGFAADSTVYHKEGASTGGTQLSAGQKSRKSDYYQLKNRLKFSYKYFPLYFPVVYISMSYAFINRMRRGQWQRIPMLVKLLFTFNK